MPRNTIRHVFASRDATRPPWGTGRAITVETPSSLLSPGSSLLPPGRGEVGRGVDPGGRRPGRGPSRSRSSMKKHLAWERRRPAGPAGRRPASSFALRARPAGRRRSQGRDPPPDLPPGRGEEQESRGVGRLTDVAVDGQERAPPPSSLLPPEGGRRQGVRAEDTAPTSLSPGRRRPAALPSLLPPGRGEVGRGVDPGVRRPGRGPSRSRSSVNYLAGRRPASFSRIARGRRDAGAPRGGTPLPTSPLKGGGARESGRRAPHRRCRRRAGARAASVFSPPPWKGGGARESGRRAPHRRRCRRAGARAASVFSPPPWKGGGRVGGDPGARRPGRGPSRSRSSVRKHLAWGRRRTRGRTPLPTSPLKGGRRRVQGGGEKRKGEERRRRPPSLREISRCDRPGGTGTAP